MHLIYIATVYVARAIHRVIIMCTIFQVLWRDSTSLVSLFRISQFPSCAWEAPFTLDLTRVDPDITYYVDVMDSLRNTLYSQCGINITSVTIPLDADLMCQANVYTITPVNPAGNGTRLSMDVNTIPDKATIYCYTQFPVRLCKSQKLQLILLQQLVSIRYIRKQVITVNMHATPSTEKKARVTWWEE